MAFFVMKILWAILIIVGIVAVVALFLNKKADKKQSKTDDHDQWTNF